MNDYVFLFPAFVLKYKGSEIKNINDSGIDFSVRLKKASEIAGIDLTSFDISGNNFMDDELKNQLITYLISCSYSDILKAKNILPRQITFLSMGVYSALYSAESISFNDGIILIKRIFEYLNNQITGKKYKMLAITGFGMDDIEAIIFAEKLDCQIVIKNNEHSFIIAGLEEDISVLNKKAQSEGALHLNLFPVSLPYHSKHIDTNSFTEHLFNGVEIKNPTYKLFSSITQAGIDTPGAIVTTIFSNLKTFIDWHKTKTTLIEMGYSHFIECGPGDSLKRISKFIDGKHNVYSFSKLLSS